MAVHPDTPVAVTGGGSGTGIASLVMGTCQIANCSRPMEPEEIELAHASGVYPKEFIVALDGIAVVVHPSNPVAQLTVDELRRVFTGEITNWQQLDGPDMGIVLLSREVNSGTHVYFREAVLSGDSGSGQFASHALMMPSSQALADEVSQNEGAIGYYGMAYLSPQQKAVAIAKAAGGPYIPPEISSVQDGSYPIARPLFMYTDGEPQGNVKQFIDFVFSAEGQSVVSEQGFVPVRE